jgi:NAD(P)H-flavin reductase
MDPQIDSPVIGHPSSDIYLPHPALITSMCSLTALDMLFEIHVPSPEVHTPSPGQFVEVSLPGIGEAPISVCSFSNHPHQFQILVRRIGNVTQALHQLQIGKSIGIRGPFGTTFPVDRELRKQNILFIAGGLGLAPLRSAIQYVLHRRWDYGKLIILYGSRTPDEQLFLEDLHDWKSRKDLTYLETVDRGGPNWKGRVGVITTLFSLLNLEDDPWSAIICGPPVMYSFVLRELRQRQIPNELIYVSLERRMKCGVGMCGHCQINGLYVCQDGPVFRYKDLIHLQEAL